jgi:hypothetical protein
MSARDILRQGQNESTGQGFQIYNEIFDEEGDVYLELEGFHFEAASAGKPRLTVQLPREWAQRLGLLDKVPKRPGPSGSSEKSNAEGETS